MDDWNKAGNEFLLRTPLWNPEEVFQKAKGVERLFELETKSILNSWTLIFCRKETRKNVCLLTFILRLC